MQLKFIGEPHECESGVGEAAGFSLHAGVAARASERATKSGRPQASWNACAVISHGPQYPPSACH
jgi:hypothetical protein